MSTAFKGLRMIPTGASGPNLLLSRVRRLIMPTKTVVVMPVISFPWVAVPATSVFRAVRAVEVG